ncbi:MAG: TldD/PmbA family protein [Clostridia bacterium]|nr:TldD/PmbA family protein [Clostridia bacterium]
MSFSEFKDKVFAEAKRLGCDAEVFMRDTEDLTVEILSHALDSYSYSRTAGACVRVKKDGRDGYHYTESFGDPEGCVKAALDNAACGDLSEHPMNGPCSYPETPEGDDTAENRGVNDMIALALDAETLALAQDERIDRTDYDSASSVRYTTYIANTLGLEAFYGGSLFITALSAVAEKDGEVHDAFAFSVGKEALQPKLLASKAAGFALAKFGAAPVPSGRYRVILQGKAMAQLLKAFSPQFSASAAQKGLSPLAGKEGTKIASDAVSITDDPLFSYFPRPFDDEGTPSRTTSVIKNGVLLSLLHNMKTAKKAGRASTSNGTRETAASPISVAPSNFILEKGEKDLAGLLSEMGDGLLITELSGLHAGVNFSTGHFSLLASGFTVEKGKIKKPVERITVAGLFDKLLSDITLVGDDLYLSAPGGSVFAAPSVYIENGLAVSGT